MFLRQTIDFGGAPEKVDADLNQLGGTQTANRLVLTAGKFSIVDVFDTNKYAHDPRNDFLNWSVIDGGAFDYAANAWGFSYGGSAEWYQDWWTIRTGVFDLSNGAEYVRFIAGRQPGAGGSRNSKSATRSGTSPASSNSSIG